MDNAFVQAIAAWQGFYALAGAAAATLVGLLFIAVSLHLDIFSDESEDEMRMLAEQVLVDFLTILMIALFFLVPSQSPAGLGLPLVAVASYDLVRRARIWLKRRSRNQFRGAPLSTSLRITGFGVVVPLLYQVTSMYVAVTILTGRTDALYWLVWVVVTMLISGSTNAWNLMVRLSEYRKRIALVSRKKSSDNP